MAGKLEQLKDLLIWNVSDYEIEKLREFAHFCQMQRIMSKRKK